MVAKPTISTSTVVSSETKDDKNFHWIYIMRKQRNQAPDDQWAIVAPTWEIVYLTQTY